MEEESQGALHPNEKLGSQIEADSEGVWHVCEDETHFVKAGWLQHRVPSFGFVIREKPTPGKLNAQLLKEKGVPAGPLYARIKAGESVTTPNGEVIKPEDVIGPERPGRSVAILGDTSDSSQMAALCRGVDMLVHEATLSETKRENAIEKGHSTPVMAGHFATEVGSQGLILTHFSQRYKPASVGDSEENKVEDDDTVEILVQEAQSVFTGNVTAAEDLMTISIPVKR